MGRARHSKLNIPFCAGLLILFLTLFSIHFTGGLYARYTTSASGGDSARVVTFGSIDLQETGDFDADGNMIVTPGVNLKKDVTVSFTASETDVYLFAKVEATGWTRAFEGGKNIFYREINSKRVLSCTVEDNWQHLESDGETHIFYRYIDTNTSVENAKIFADADAYGNQIAVNEDTTKADLEQLGTVKFAFEATAVQAGGFADAEEAWTAVSSHG